MIYLDNAATSLYRPPQVAEAVAAALNSFGNPSRSSFGPSLDSARVVLETRQLVAELFNVGAPEQVAFTANATESLNIALKGVLNPGDKVVSTVLEHNSVLRPLYEMEARGVQVCLIGCEGSLDAGDASQLQRRRGRLDYKALRKAVQEGVKAVVCTHASNVTGNLVDIHKIGKWCQKAGALFIVDASQTAGVFPLDMQEDKIDILCFTGHKGLWGPQGTGGICVRKGLTVRPLLSGGSGIMTFSHTHPAVMPTALEAGTLNGHGLAGLRAALLAIKKTGISHIRLREQRLMQAFYEQIQSLSNIKLYGDFSGWDRAPVVALNLGEEDAGIISDYLAREHQIYTRSGGHCAPLMHKALGTEKQGVVRFSFGYHNTMEEVAQTVEALSWY